MGKRFVFLGPPGAGKGTQALVVSRDLSIPWISTGAIFRDAMANRTAMGKQIAQFVNAGLLVPDKLTDAIVAERIEQGDCTCGFILDGYPRNSDQAQALDKELIDHAIKLDAVVYFKVEPALVVERMSQRRICRQCGHTYNLVSQPSKVSGVCDFCQGVLVPRSDDKPEAIQQRIEIYENKTRPLFDYYEQKSILKVLNASKSVEEVGASALKICRAA